MHRKVRRMIADDCVLDPEDDAVGRDGLKVEPGFCKHLLNHPPGLECLSECLASPLHRLDQCVASKNAMQLRGIGQAELIVTEILRPPSKFLHGRKVVKRHDFSGVSAFEPLSIYPSARGHRATPILRPA